MVITKKNFVSILQPTIEVVRDFDWSNTRGYANWTAQTFYIVNHSTRLFAYAAARTPIAKNDFHNRFIKHMMEEKGHENLASTDLKALGYTLSDFPELPSTSALYQTQYYWVNEVSPYAFFGYLMALEGLAATVGKDVREAVNKSHEAKSTKFVKVHSEEDLHHIEECFEWLQKIPEGEMQFVYRNLVNSLKNYANMVNEISAATLTFKLAS